MKIDEKLLEHLLELAKLNLEEDERRGILADLNKILDMIQIINTLDLKNIEPFKYTNLQKLIKRADVSLPSYTQEEILKNSKDTNPPFFKVPKVIK
jgi:aspartyl-tRNA(Asn)/glutamyl-tRNA(Gln) amidotransferase subunit C